MTPSRPSGSQAGAHVQEFSIRVPKNTRKKHQVMRFNATLNVDFAKWNSVRMERENNMKEFKAINEEETPKFGAGSEYNRDLREEVRRKKFGIIAKRYKPEAQPWILKVGGKSGKKFKGIREGGVSENAAFYVFTHAPDGAIEAYPLNEWYNFHPIQRYKSLSAEEAEEEFSRRKRVMNYFSLMLRRRLKTDDEPEDPEEKNAAKGGGSKKKEFQISEMDEWIDSDEEDDSEEEDKNKKKDDSDDEDSGKKKKGKKGVGKKKKERDLDDEAFEESDDGDEEGRELEYISDSSEDEPDPESKLDKELISVAEEEALKSSESEEEEEKKSDESEKDEDEKSKEGKDKSKESKEKKKKKDKKKKSKQAEKKESSSDSSSDTSDSEAETKNKKKKDTGNGSNSKDSRALSPPTPSQEVTKRKFNNMPSDLTVSDNSNSSMAVPAKKPKIDAPPLPLSFAGVLNTNAKDESGITEEAVRRYLMRKPTTAAELLQKFKNKKTGVSNEKLVETMTQILKKINPVKQTIQGKMYLSLKSNK